MSLIDSPLALKSQLIRKGIAYASEVPRAFARASASQADYLNGPPIIGNSIPKSGTHLLLQIARAIPGTCYYGSFVSWARSWELVSHTQDQMNKRIDRIVPNEVVPAHIRYSAGSAAKLQAINAIHLLIVRDPRDIALSEAEYLTHMNRWHRVHRYFKNVSDPGERIRMVIDGVPEAGDLFPDLGQRLRPFLGWLDDPNVTVVRYEDLRGAGLDNALESIAAAVAQHRPADGATRSHLAALMRDYIDPSRSHTFRSGRLERWRSELSTENKRRLEAVAADVIGRLGYEL